MSSLDLHAATVFLGLVLLAVAAYAIRLVVEGPAHYARVDAAGGSPLLGKRAMEMGYWALQPLARGCMWAGITPDRITWLSLALGAAAGVALATGHLGVGGVLAAVSALGDALDGLVARATGTATRRGGLFDAAVDRYGEFFFVGGLALHDHANRLRLGLSLLALLGSFMVSYGSAKAEALGVTAPRGAMRRAERAAYLCAGALLSPIAALAAERADLAPWLGEAPMLLALALVGVVSNVSAVRRLGAVGRAAGAPLLAAPSRAVTAPAIEPAPARAGAPRLAHEGPSPSKPVAAARRSAARLASP